MTYPMCDNPSNQRTRGFRNGFILRNHTNFVRQQVLAAVSVRIEFKDQKDPLVPIGQYSTNHCFSGGIVRAGKRQRDSPQLLCISQIACGTWAASRWWSPLASETRKAWSCSDKSVRLGFRKKDPAKNERKQNSNKTKFITGLGVKMAVKSTRPDKELKLVEDMVTGNTFCSTLRKIFDLPCDMVATRKKKCLSVSVSQLHSNQWSLIKVPQILHRV